MDASFSLGNAVYSANSATLTFSDDVQENFPTAPSAGTAPTCYVTGAHLVSAGVYTSCSATGANTVLVSNLKASPGNTQFIFRVLATLNTTNGQNCRIVTAKTENGNSILIDESTTGLAAFTRGTYTNQTVTVNGTVTGWGLGDNTGTDYFKEAGMDVAGADNSVDGFRLAFKQTQQYTDTTVLTIKFPFQATDSNNNHWSLPNGTAVSIEQDATDLATACTVGGVTPADNSANINSSIAGSATNLGSITITFSSGYTAGGAAVVAANDWVCIFLSQGTDTGTEAGYVKNPLVAGNASTYYEIFIKTDNVGAGSNLNLMMVIQPEVVDRIFAAGSATAGAFTCSTAMLGAIVEIKADVTQTLVPNGYYFNVEFPTDGASAGHFNSGMDSGLSNDDDYPAVLTTPASGAVVKFVSKTNADSIRATSAAVASA